MYQAEYRPSRLNKTGENSSCAFTTLCCMSAYISIFITAGVALGAAITDLSARNTETFCPPIGPGLINYTIKESIQDGESCSTYGTPPTSHCSPVYRAICRDPITDGVVDAGRNSTINESLVESGRITSFVAAGLLGLTLLAFSVAAACFASCLYFRSRRRNERNQGPIFMMAPVQHVPMDHVQAVCVSGSENGVAGPTPNSRAFFVAVDEDQDVVAAATTCCSSSW